MKYSGKELRLINKVYSLFRDNLSCIEAWGFYIFSDDLNNGQELKNKLGTLWVAALFDSIKAQEKLIEKYSKEAETLGLVHIDRYCRQASVFVDAIKELIQQYSMSEQLYIQNIRNQFVHSHLSGRHAESIRVIYVENGKLKDHNLGHDKYHEIVRPLFEQGSTDSTLKELIGRFKDQKGLYWNILGEIQKSHKVMYQAMQEGKEFQWITISV